MRTLRYTVLGAALALIAALGVDRAGHTPNVSAAAQAAVSVSMQNDLYAPDAITIAAGTTVVWSNDDTATGEDHDVIAEDGSFASETFGVGGTFAYTFTSPGEYRYYCDLHEGMYGVVYVQ
jgi:plastocyanin